MSIFLSIRYSEGILIMVSPFLFTFRDRDKHYKNLGCFALFCKLHFKVLVIPLITASLHIDISFSLIEL